MKKYYDWLNDVDVPSHKKKSLSEKHIQNQLANLLSFKESQPDYERILMKDFNDNHVALFHDYLLQKAYSGKTYNNKMYTMSHAFGYFIKELGYNIQNPFDDVTRKQVQASKSFVELSDFKELLDLTTEPNGIKFEKCTDRVKRVSLYREWLCWYWELALYTGGRREDIAELRLTNIHELHIDIRDYKTSNSKRSEIHRYLPRSAEFNDLLHRLTEHYGLSGNDYLIEPNETNRTKLSNHASKAFTHYWRLLDPGYYARMYSLRDTHITMMINRYGNKYEGIFGTHQNIKTSLENYASYEKLIQQYAGKSMIA
ncbi:hypothetical protein GBO34_00970 [Roseivirga pacifica]|uniref:tyrosine-type recombinase/integrase n=1 Tax=Roseivirga pacifica TaxID=1267423 RepID=UPI002095C6A7|nr:hypothetical protein [Roseivirga pacifica]MCO6377257.1 hypothetical protein [Roseivirga pacifica]